MIHTDPAHGPLLTSSCNIIAQQTEDKRDSYAPIYLADLRFSITLLSRVIAER